MPLKAQEVLVFKFTEEELKTLKVRKVRGADNKTEYSVSSNNNGNFLKAIADNAASGLGKQIKIDIHDSEIRFMAFCVERDTLGKLFTRAKIKRNSKVRKIHLCSPIMRIKKGTINNAAIIPI